MADNQAHPAPDAGSNGEELVDERAMISALRRYRAAKAEQERRKERANEYLREIRSEIEADLAAGDEHIERLRSSMLTFITTHNGGRKFSVPGLGTATTTTRTTVEITDEERLVAAVPEEQRDGLFDRKLNTSRAKAYAKSAFEEAGEQVPGVEAARVTALSVRLSAD
ncbi:MAG: hypothetical protein ACFB50_15640 [Rubrobacteraceae bacterium]